MVLRVGVITVSDRSSRGEREDASGPVLQQQVVDQGWAVARMKIIPDDFQTIKELLSRWADGGDLDVILTSGGTGFASRDITPEATQAVIERAAPGLAEAMRAHGSFVRSLTKTTTSRRVTHPVTMNRKRLD